jgi:hypothetical protein
VFAPFRKEEQYRLPFRENTHEKFASDSLLGKCANTQEKARQKSPDKVADNFSQDRDETSKGHANGEVYGGFPNTIEEHIPVPRDAEN